MAGPNRTTYRHYWRFQLADIVNYVTPYLSSAEIRRLRLVSRPMDRQILSSPRLTNTIQIDKKWASKNGAFRISFDFEEALSIKYANNSNRVIFDNFPLRQNGFMTKFWIATLDRVITSVTLKNISMSCDEYCVFLHKCQSIQEVTLANLSFEADPGQDQREGGLTYSCLCRHEICSIPATEFRAQNLKKISIQQIPVIPLCILDYLRRTSNGHLVEFECKNGVLDAKKREKQIPTLASMMEGIRDLLQVNDPTLRRFTWDNITSGHTILGNLLHPDPDPDLPSGLVQLKLGQDKQSRGGAAFHYLDFAARQLTQRDRLEELELNLLNGPNVVARLEEMLPLMVRLKKLTIAIQGTQVEGGAETGLDLRQLQNLPRLKYLSISDKVNNPRISDTAAYPFISNNFLTNLPPSLKGLNFDVRVAREEEGVAYNYTNINMVDVINAPSARIMTSLAIKRGNLIDDAAMQIIITNMPGLQELCVNNSPDLTDSGITGLPKDVVHSMEETDSYIFLDDAELDDAIQVQRNLKELIHLRLLNLKGCKKLSDISAHSINFPHLRELDVSSWYGLTDLGVVWIGEKNPCLERLTCKDNKKVSKLGVDAILVKTHFKIQKILISAATMKKSFQTIYEVCPEFNDFVTVCNKSTKT